MKRERWLKTRMGRKFIAEIIDQSGKFVGLSVPPALAGRDEISSVPQSGTGRTKPL